MIQTISDGGIRGSRLRIHSAGFRQSRIHSARGGGRPGAGWGQRRAPLSGRAGWEHAAFFTANNRGGSHPRQQLLLIQLSPREFQWINNETISNTYAPRISLSFTLKAGRTLSTFADKQFNPPHLGKPSNQRWFVIFIWESRPNDENIRKMWGYNLLLRIAFYRSSD